MTSSSDTADRAAAGTHHRAQSGHEGLWPFSGWYIAATVAALLLFWPLGLAMLAWALWHRQVRTFAWWKSLRDVRPPTMNDLGGFVWRRPSNEALAAYLAQEQERLREEQQKLDELVKAFEAFKDTERKANDQRDFENFLRSRESAGQ